MKNKQTNKQHLLLVTLFNNNVGTYCKLGSNVSLLPFQKFTDITTKYRNRWYIGGVSEFQKSATYWGLWGLQYTPTPAFAILEPFL